jgi:hypothetical protein
VAVKAPQLHSLYCAGYVEARRVSDGGVLRAFEISIRGTGLSTLERLILEFALHDATNGTPMRDRRAFDRALAEGAELLAGLGMRFEAGAAPWPGSCGIAAHPCGTRPAAARRRA